MVETEAKEDELKLALLEVAYRELREKGPDVSADDLRMRFSSLWIKWRNHQIEAAGKLTAERVPYKQLVCIWPMVYDLLWDMGHYWEDLMDEMEEAKQAEVVGYGLAVLRYENNFAAGRISEPMVTDEEAVVWLERRAWLVNIGNAAQPGLPFC